MSRKKLEDSELINDVQSEEKEYSGLSFFKPKSKAKEEKVKVKKKKSTFAFVTLKVLKFLSWPLMYIAAPLLGLFLPALFTAGGDIIQASKNDVCLFVMLALSFAFIAAAGAAGHIRKGSFFLSTVFAALTYIAFVLILNASVPEALQMDIEGNLFLTILTVISIAAAFVGDVIVLLVKLFRKKVLHIYD